MLDESSPEAAALDAMTPLLAEIVERITVGDHAGAAEQFANDLLLGPGGWTDMPEDVRDGMIANAPTVPDELNDPEPWSTDKSVLARYRGPLLLTSGEQSPPVHTAVVRRLAELLPQAKHVVCTGAGHIPHVTHPDEYIHQVLAFTSTSDQRR